MHRREFLGLLGLVMFGGGMSAYGGRSHWGDLTGNKRILVIGAGLAGLAAAERIEAQWTWRDYLGARDCIGGRIWTSQKWPDLPLDLGATWIHGVKGNPITTIADELKASRLVTSYDRSVIYNTDGRLLTGSEEARLESIRSVFSVCFAKPRIRMRICWFGRQLLRWRRSSPIRRKQAVFRTFVYLATWSRSIGQRPSPIRALVEQRERVLWRRRLIYSGIQTPSPSF